MSRAMATQLTALSQHLAEKKAGFYHPVKEAALVKYLAPGRPLLTQTDGRAPPPPQSGVSRSLLSELQVARGGEDGPVGTSVQDNGRVPQPVSVSDATPVVRSPTVEEPDGVQEAAALEQTPRNTVPAQHRCVCACVSVCASVCVCVW